MRRSVLNIGGKIMGGDLGTEAPQKLRRLLEMCSKFLVILEYTVQCEILKIFGGKTICLPQFCGIDAVVKLTEQFDIKFNSYRILL